MTPLVRAFGIRHSTLGIALLSAVAFQIQLAHAAEHKLSITVFEGASERPVPCRNPVGHLRACIRPAAGRLDRGRRLRW